LKGKLLGKRATPGDAQYIYLLVAWLVEQFAYQPGMPRKKLWKERSRGITCARYIKANDFDGRVEGIDEPLEDFEVDAEPVHQE